MRGGIRMFAVGSALIMIAIAFQVAITPAAEAAGNTPPSPDGGLGGGGGKPPAPEPPPPQPPAGGEGGGESFSYNESDPDGSVNVTFQTPANLTGSYANHTVEPILESVPGSYTYVTSFGNFSFNESAPYLMSVRDLDGRLLVSASAFTVEGNQNVEIAAPTVLQADNTTFQSSYSFVTGFVTQGTLDTTAVFNNTSRPKVSATYTPAPGSTMTQWKVKWKIITTAYYLQTSVNTTLYFGDLTSLQSVNVGSPEARVGEVGEIPMWNSTIFANWSDMGSGNLSVGPVAIDPSTTGQGLVVSFPEGVSYIDPSLIAWSSDSYGTRFTNQKKVFYHNGRYYAFFGHGGGPTPGIRYSVGVERLGGMTWTVPTPVVTTSFQYWSGFDVDMRDGVFGMTWFTPNGRELKFMKGYAKTDRIAWNKPVNAGIILTSDRTVYTVNLAISYDGFFWIAAPRDWGFNAHWVEVYRSLDPEGEAFGLMQMFIIPPTCPHQTVRLVPLPGGEMRLFAANKCHTGLSWRTYQITGEWSPACSIDVYFPPDQHRAYAFTAAYRPDPSSPGLTRVVVVRGLGQVVYYDIRTPCTPEPAPVLVSFALGGSYPAIQLDLNGDLHVFWTHEACSGCSSRSIWYRRYPIEGGATELASPFTLVGDFQYLSTSLMSVARRAFVVFMSPSGGGVNVYFASLPTRTGGGGSGSDAWNRPGLSSHGSYFEQLNEYVSPSNGVLVVKQTDLSVPGRGLDLSIQRLFRTPEAFAGTEPWDYEELANQAYSLGKGWSLNFPTLTWKYLYLWDGQRYIVDWSGNTFENTNGEYFRLDRLTTGSTVWLRTKSGILYTFGMYSFVGDGPTWALVSIQDVNANQVLFNYNSNGDLTSILDTAGRTAQISYAPHTGCSGTGNPPKICSIIYGERTVQYWYSGDLLTNVVQFPTTDSKATTSYEYCVSTGVGCGVVNARLLHSVIYATHARTRYYYQSAKVGTETNAFLVTSQKLQDDGGVTVRKRTFNYDLVDGTVAFDRVKYYSGDPELTYQGSTLYNMDTVVGSVTQTQVDKNGAKVAQSRQWFGAGGVVQQEAFASGTASDNYNPTTTAYAHYDVYGNLVYERDVLGKESFQSYVHSNHQGEFYGPGRLDLKTKGKIWSDDFRDRESDWTVSSSGSATIDSSTFGVLPPSLLVTKYGADAWAQHGFTPQSSGHVVNMLVRMRETSYLHELLLRSGGLDRVVIKFQSDGFIWYSHGVSEYPLQPYLAGQWYLVTVEFKPNLGGYDLWIDGTKVRSDLTLRASGSIDTIRLHATLWAGMWANEVAVFGSRTITLSSLTGTNRIRILSPLGKQIGEDVVTSSSSVGITLSPKDFPRFTIQIRDWTWAPVFTSQSREFWGGSTYDFIEPQHLGGGFTKTKSGFLRNDYSRYSIWVEDTRPYGSIETANDGGDSWWWRSDVSVLSGAYYHQSVAQPHRHGHGFKDSGITLTTNAAEYLIQYVYLSPDKFPAEILREYQRQGEWCCLHRASWGADLIRWGNGLYPQADMGSIPDVTDRWMMTVVLATDLDPSGSVTWNGATYFLAGGEAKWDVTARGGPETGQIKVTGLNDYTLSAPDTGTWCAANIGICYLYTPGQSHNSFTTAFPQSGFLTTSGGYRSPWFEIFGGDEFQWGATNFLDNTAMSGYIKDRLAGTRDGASGSARESYLHYDARGNVLDTQVMASTNPVTWTTSSRTYDIYNGNVVSATSTYNEVDSHQTTYTYNPPYNSAYLDSVWDCVGGTQPGCVGGEYLHTYFSYDFNTGNLQTVTNPKGTTTNYDYDDAGRQTRITHADSSFVTREYYPTLASPNIYNLVVVKDENYLDTPPIGQYNAGDRLRQTWECYDPFGKLAERARFVDTGPAMAYLGCSISAYTGFYSKETWSYNWQEMEASYALRDSSGGVLRSTTKSYDFLGRMTRVANRDGTGVDIIYDDATNKRTVVVDEDIQNARTTEYLSDWAGRLKAVREAWSGCQGGYCETNYYYDLAGNLLTTLTPPDANGVRQNTSHEYDLLNRVKKTTYPDGTFEDYQYFKSGMLKEKQDRAGGLTTYSYDELKRTNLVTRPSGSYLDYDYDNNGNLWKLRQVGGTSHGDDLEYSYDGRNRMETETFTIGTSTHEISYTYDDANNVLSMVPPNPSESLHYAYDAFNRPCAVGSVGGITCASTTSTYARATYNVDDLLDVVTYETGATDASTNYDYDVNGRPSIIETFKGQTTHLRLDYEDYDSLGDPIRVKATGPRNIGGGTFTLYECAWFDSLGRLYDAKTSASTGCSYAATDYSWNLQWSYDALGNRKTAADEGTTTHYRYDTYSRLCRTKVGSTPTSCTEAGTGVNEYAYNAGGELTSRKVGTVTSTFEWEDGQPTSVNGGGGNAEDYEYDGSGRRVERFVPDTDLAWYLYSGLSVVREYKSYGDEGVRYVFLAGLRVAKIDDAGTTTFYASDALGSVRVAMDSAGNRLITLATRPFGVCAYGCASEPSYAYTGEYREGDLGGWEFPDLIYLHSRWYDPTIGRFLSPDDRLGSLVLPQDQNRYVYVVNNPMKYTDPTGHFGPALGVVAVFIATALGLSFSILYTAQWLARSATGAEQAGFLTGLALAFFVGLALSAVCAGSAMTGCVAGVLLASSILGSIIAAATYVAVTVWLGGHPTTEGFAHALMWGGVAGGAGASAGGAIRALAARGVNAVKAARPFPGEDIVGTGHNEYRPTQSFAFRGKVEAFAQKMMAGEKFPPIKVFRQGDAHYIWNGHHRYVASKLAGVDIDVTIIPRPRLAPFQPRYSDWGPVHYVGG